MAARVRAAAGLPTGSEARRRRSAHRQHGTLERFAPLSCTQTARQLPWTASHLEPAACPRVHDAVLWTHQLRHPLPRAGCRLLPSGAAGPAARAARTAGCCCAGAALIAPLWSANHCCADADGLPRPAAALAQAASGRCSGLICAEAARLPCQQAAARAASLNQGVPWQPVPQTCQPRQLIPDRNCELLSGFCSCVFHKPLPQGMPAGAMHKRNGGVGQCSGAGELAMQGVKRRH